MLVARALSKSYRSGMPILEGVSLELHAHETMAVIGPSGGGKTTLLYILCGLLPPDKGVVLLNDVPVNKCSTEIAIILQDFGLLPWKTILQNVALGLKIQGVDKRQRHQRARQVLMELGLAGRERDYPTQLSGGEQQRVAIARALAMSPKLFLMDEPFSSLDAITREKVQLTFLETWMTNRIPYVLVTHSINEAVLLARKILIMAGKPASIVASFDNPNFGDPAYRHQESYFQTALTVRREMERHW